MRKGESDPSFFCYGGKAECQNRWKSETQEAATSWRGTSAVHQLVAFPRVSRLVLAAVWGSGGSPGAKVVGASGGKPGPLGGRAAVQPHLVTFGIPPLRPALGRVLPELLPAVGGQIQESVRRCHHFIAAAGGPVGLEDLVTVSEIADQDAEVPVCDQLVHGVLRHRVPGNGPAHEVAVTDALLVRTFAERGVGNVAGMQVGQLANLAVGEGAAL